MKKNFQKACNSICLLVDETGPIYPRPIPDDRTPNGIVGYERYYTEEILRTYFGLIKSVF